METGNDCSPGLTGDKDMSSLHWFPWHPKDWLTSDTVGRMNDAQIVSYFTLLNRQWLCTNGKLPEDIETLSKYAMHDLSHPAMQCVLDRFPIHETGGRANQKLHTIYLEQHSKYEKRSNSAKNRWNKAEEDAMHDAMHEHSESCSSSSSIQNTEDFKAFWNVYPRKEGKKDALKAWIAAKDRPEIDKVIATITLYASSEGWRKDGGKFIPLPATWIRAGRWDDQPPKPPKRESFI